MSKRRNKTEMFPLIELWESTTQDREQFCQSHEVSLATFSYWRTKYRKSQKPSTELFSELQPEISSKIEVVYPNGVKVSLPPQCDPAMLKLLIGMHV